MILLILSIVAAVVAYLFVGAWTFGFIAGNDDRWSDLDYYHDEPGPWFGGIFWPLYWGWYLLYTIIFQHMTKRGFKKAKKVIEIRKFRVEEEKRIRVEAQKAQQEANEEIEAALRREEAEEQTFGEASA